MTQPTSPTQKRNLSSADLSDRSITSSKRPKASAPQHQRTTRPQANDRNATAQVDAAADDNQDIKPEDTADNAAGDVADDEMDVDETDPDATISDVHDAIEGRERGDGRSSSPADCSSGGEPLTEENLRMHDVANLRAKMVEGRK